ncbi:MAG: hypothetical protein AAGH90_03370 [Pseudomonadota bacterium]
MSDKIFFPLVFMIGIAIVAAALLVGRDTSPSGPIGGAASGDYSIVPIEGDNFLRLEGLTFGATSTLEAGIMTLSSGPNAQPAQVSVGPHFKLAADLENVYSGHTIEIAVEAKTASGAALEVNYDTGRQGESGWQSFELTDDWQTYRFSYDVPLRPDGSESGFDYLGLRPVGDPMPAIVQIRRIEFRRRGRWAN